MYSVTTDSPTDSFFSQTLQIAGITDVLDNSEGADANQFENVKLPMII